MQIIIRLTRSRSSIQILVRVAGLRGHCITRAGGGGGDIVAVIRTIRGEPE